MTVLLIALGGAAGALARYGVSRVAQPLGGASFPAGTLIVNIIGAFLLGFLATYLIERTTISPDVRIGLTVGVLGAFTTFSTFSVETVALMNDGEWLFAATNVLASVGICLAMAWLGQTLARL